MGLFLGKRQKLEIRCANATGHGVIRMDEQPIPQVQTFAPRKFYVGGRLGSGAVFCVGFLAERVEREQSVVAHMIA